MITCGDGCHNICDFCAHQMSCGTGTITGFCIAKKKYVERCDCCNDDFHCFNSLLSTHKPNIVMFLYFSILIFTRAYMPGVSIMERCMAWKSFADYTYENKHKKCLQRL